MVKSRIHSRASMNMQSIGMMIEHNTINIENLPICLVIFNFLICIEHPEASLTFRNFSLLKEEYGEEFA